MSEKIRRGNLMGIDLDQVLAWNRIPTYKTEDELFEVDECDLKLYISGSTITIRKISRDKGVKAIEGSSKPDICLEKPEFDEFFQRLVKKFPDNISFFPED